MTPQRWSEIKERLAVALEMEAARRPAYLAEIGSTDPDLRRELESLLASQQEAGTDFLNAPAAPASVFESRDDPNRFIGCRLGPYQIAEQIGVGGMGEVYRAFRADDEYRKEVAIKLVRAGRDSGFVVSRFKNERQILANLDHPNIARLLEGGTTDEGVPYFVMELIRGEPIDEYCHAHKLPTAERLKLFSQVCSAVQYAHQRLTIHRDIKPSNILVTAEGTPKLLDFGIAKILDGGVVAGGLETTQTVLRVMTPGYASPEQVKGEPITTASDVYSLGVVLYELLTGHSPYRLAGSAPHEIARAVCESEPEKPSTAVRRKANGDLEPERRLGPRAAVGAVRDGSAEKLSKRLTGDLDNIVLMALRKEPQRRYASVEQFGEDLRRHLGNLPVFARKDTAGYRLSKFIARHKTGVAAAAVVAATLLMGIAVTLREAHVAREQAQIARAERARADRRFKDVRELANSLLFEVHDGIKDLPGSTPVRELLLNRALQYLDSLSQEAGGDLSLQHELAAAYDRVGDLQWNTTANRGDSAGALRSYGKALAIRESLAVAAPADLKLQAELSDEYFRMANSLEAAGDFATALNTLRRALAITERIGAGTSDPKIRDRLAGSYYFIAGLLIETGDPLGALENYRKAASIREAITTGDQHEATSVRMHLAADYSGIAHSMMLIGDLSQAMQVQGTALAILKELCKANATNATLREYLAETHNLLGTLLEKQGDQGRALESHRQAHEIFKELLSADPTNFLAKANFGFSDESMGEILVARGDITRGLQRIREGLGAFEAMVASGAKNRYALSGLAQSYFGMGMANSALADDAKPSLAERRDHWREARSWYEKSLSIWVEKQNHGALDSQEREMPERAAQGMAKCDAALARLRDIAHE